MTFSPCLRSVCLTVFAAGMVMMSAVPAHADSVEPASKFVEALGNKAIGIVSDKTTSKAQKQTRLEGLFMDNVDFPWVARFVMGRFWREATADQKDRYVKQYEKFQILHYTSRFSDYTSGSFKISGARDDGDGEFTISMQIQPGDKGSEPVLVDYRVRKQDKGGYKIFDVIVEGVSMITTQRSEFASILSNKGIDALIEQLSAKSVASDKN